MVSVFPCLGRDILCGVPCLVYPLLFALEEEGKEIMTIEDEKNLEERLTLTAEKEYSALVTQFVRVRKQYIDGLNELQANINDEISAGVEAAKYEKDGIWVAEDELRDIEKVSQFGVALVQIFNTKKAFQNVWMNPTEVAEAKSRD